MIEYPAMIYKNNRGKSYIANCLMNNLFGFGKTEEDAIENLKQSLKSFCKNDEFCIRATHGLSF